MKNSIFTENQIKFLISREIKVGGVYMLPQWGFKLYPKPEPFKGQYIATNPMTKSLNSSPIVVEEIKNGFAKINWRDKPAQESAWIYMNNLEERDNLERLFLLLVCAIPFIIYNLFKNHNKNSSSDEDRKEA